MMDKVNIGIIGCGNISAKYIHTLTDIFDITQVVALCDLSKEKAELRAEQFGIDRVCSSSEELLALDCVDIVAVLTNPLQHFEVTQACLMAKKHTYVEKPLSLNVDDGEKLVCLAKNEGLILSGAPDTVLGAGLQTAKKMIEDGWIGLPIAAVSHILTGGPESWHPDPAFLYHKGAGPLYDVAPYYVAGLTYLFGSVESVACSAKKTWDRRPITSQPLYGTMIDVEVPTYLAGILNMKNGVICTLHHSFDVSHTKLDYSIEIYGTNGSLIIDTPCEFSGDILYRGKYDEKWSHITPIFPYRSDCRGIGIADMASALLENRNARVGADFIYHTLEVLQRLDESAQKKTVCQVASRFTETTLMSLSPNWGQDKIWDPTEYGIPAH